MILYSAPNAFNDLCCYLVGCVVCFIASYSTKTIWNEAVKQTELWLQFLTILKWMEKLFITVICALLYCTIIPLLFGFVCTLLVATREKVNESVGVSLVEYWSMGLLVLIMKTKWDLSIMALDAPGGMGAKLNRVFRDGIRNINGMFIIKDILLCYCMDIADIYLASYFVSRTVSYLVINATYTEQTIIMRFTTPFVSLLYALLFGLFQLIKYLMSMYEKQLDSKYLVGLELQNNLKSKRNLK